MSVNGSIAATQSAKSARRRRLSAGGDIPPGIYYSRDCFSAEKEKQIIEYVESLGLGPVMMCGKYTKRLIKKFGSAWLGHGEAGRVESKLLPAPLVAFLEEVTSVLPVAARDYAAVIVQKYPPGSGIGWHCDDEDLYDTILGVSLGATGMMRFRPRGETTAAGVLELEPRSTYVLTGDARWKWEHSIAPVRACRYSLTYRSLMPSRLDSRSV